MYMTGRTFAANNTISVVRVKRYDSGVLTHLTLSTINDRVIAIVIAIYRMLVV